MMLGNNLLKMMAHSFTSSRAISAELGTANSWADVCQSICCVHRCSISKILQAGYAYAALREGFSLIICTKISVRDSIMDVAAFPVNDSNALRISDISICSGCMKGCKKYCSAEFLFALQAACKSVLVDNVGQGPFQGSVINHGETYSTCVLSTGDYDA